MSRQMTTREVEADKEQFADLYRDMRGQFQKGRPTKVALKHVRMKGGADGAGDSDVSVWDAEHFDDLHPDEFTKQVLTEAYEDANIYPMGSIQVYGIFVYRKNKGTHDNRIMLKIEGGSTDGAHGGSTALSLSEGPDDAGRTSQLMRHDEAFARLTIAALTSTLQSKDKTIERLEGMVERFMGTHVQTMEALDRLIGTQEERSLRLERERKMYGYMDQGIEKAMEVGPLVLAAKLKAKNPELAQAIVAMATNPAPAILKQFLADMETKPEVAHEVFAAVAKLPNGQALIQTMVQLAQAEKANAQAAQAPANGAPNGQH